MIKNVAIIGSSGALGRAFLKHVSVMYPYAIIHACTRELPKENEHNITYHKLDYDDEKDIADCAARISENLPLDLVIVSTGILHEDEIKPEKSLRDLSSEKFHRLFAVNTILPALIAKHFLPKLNKGNRAVFAALSARVGSISDNQLGGWYAYRASKVALNMVVKNAAIEIGRRNKNAIIVGLHPGTVKSDLSKPFQANVPEDKLFTPAFSAGKLLEVLESLTSAQSGSCFDWDGQKVPA